MARVRVARDVPGTVSEAETLWYDPARWPAWVDGFGHVVELEGPWPARGARLVWDSPPGGRGRVVERVVACEQRVGQTLEIEDERIRGTQRVAFEPLADGVAITLEIEWTRRSGGLAGRVVDALFVRRPFAESLRRTLARFGRELAADREPLR